MHEGAVSAGRVLVIAAAFVIVIAGMKAASVIVVPFLLAVFISIVTAPLLVIMRKRGVPTWLALLVMFLVLSLVILFGAGVLGQSIARFTTAMPEIQKNLQSQFDTMNAWLEERNVTFLDPIFEDALNAQAVTRYASGFMAAMGVVISQAFLILLVVTFILLEAAVLPSKVRSLPGMDADAWHKLESTLEDIRRYMMIKTLTSAATGALVAALLAILGVPFALLLGVLAFLLNYVPNIGSIIAGVPGVTLALIQHGWEEAILATIGYLAINISIGNFIEPRLMGFRLGLSPLVVLLSLIFWGWVLGPIGMLLSVPLTMVVRIALERRADSSWLAQLMGTGTGPVR